MHRVRRHSMYIWVVVALFVGLALAGSAGFQAVKHDKVWFLSISDLLAALGEGLIVAAVLAVVVDRHLKRELGEEISEVTAAKTASVFFNDLLGRGRGLPDQYFEGMRGLAASDGLILVLDWILEFEWHSTDPPFLRIRGVLDSTTINVGSADLTPQQYWVMQYYDGRPASYFVSFESEILVPDPDPRRAPSIRRNRLDRVELESLTEDAPFGKRLALARLADITIPVRATRIAKLEAVSFHASTGLMPLVCRYPTLRQRVSISGGALKDIDVTLFGDDSANPTSAISGAGTYEIGFGVRGTTVRVHWSPKPTV